LLAVSGCVRERVVKWDPPLGGLPGASSETPIVSENRFTFVDPTRAPAGGIRQEDEQTGEVHLYAHSGRHLMAHIYTTLLEGERELFTNQVLSAATRAEFEARGLDPASGFDMLLRDRDDIFALFDLMPMGEYTPGVIWEKLGQFDGQNVVRLGVNGPATNELRYRYFDMIFEHGNWRLRWFGPAGHGVGSVGEDGVVGG